MLFRASTTLLNLILLVSGAVASPRQDGPPNRVGCALIDEARPPQFIVYEGKSETEIRLRLRNNTNCPIVVETDDRYPTQLKKIPGGGGTVETVFDSRDGLRLRLHYLIQNNRKEGVFRQAYGWGDSVFIYEIPAGQSIIFEVPRRHFKRRSDIAVPFSYVWEGSKSTAGVGGVVHRVHFLFEELPSSEVQ